MHRIILFLLLIALASAGAAWVANQSGEFLLTGDGWSAHTSLPKFALLLGITIVAASSLGASCRRCGARRKKSAARGASGVTRAAATPSPTACSRSAMAMRPPPAPMRISRASMPATIRWRFCCTRNPPSSAATAKARNAAFHAMAKRDDTRLLGLRGLFIEAQRSPTIRFRGDDRGRSAEARPRLDLGLAGRARLPLRQGRLERGAVDPRDQSCLRPDRQGDLPAPARRAADGARAGAGNARPRSVARKRDGSGETRADPGAGRRARQQIRGRGASDAPRDAICGDGVACRARIPISPTPMRM